MKGRWCGVHWNNRALLSLLENQPSLPLRGLKDKVCDDLVETILMVMYIRFLFEKLRTFLQWSTYFFISRSVIYQMNCKVLFTRKSVQQYHRGWVFNYQALKGHVEKWRSIYFCFSYWWIVRTPHHTYFWKNYHFACKVKFQFLFAKWG